MTKPFQPVLGAFTSDKNETIVKQFMADVSRFAQASYQVAPVQTVSFTCNLLIGAYPCSGTITATLPPAKDIIGKPYIFKNVGAGTVTVSRSGSDNIDTGTTVSLAAGASTYVISDGVSKWYTVSGTGGGGGGGDMLKANNLSDVVNSTISFQNLTYTPLGGSSPSTRSARTKVEELGVSVMDFGAVGNAVTDDTTAIQNAINYVSSLGGGDVLFPVARFKCTGTLTLPPNVNLVGVREGPFGSSGSYISTTIAPTLLITNNATSFITQTGGVTVAHSNVIKNLVFAYPSQIAPNSGAAITAYPFTITLTQGDVFINQCLFYNAYDAISLTRGRFRITDCNFGTLHTGIYGASVTDWLHCSNLIFSPYYTIGEGFSFPQAIDNKLKLNSSAGIKIVRADGFTMTNITMFMYYAYGFYFDTDATSAYGMVTNCDLDSQECAIYMKSANSSAGGVQFQNINIGCNGTNVIKGGFYLDSGGASTPRIVVVGGMYRTGTGVACYTINAGFLSLDSFGNTPSGPLPGNAVTAPGVPGSGVTITSTFPYPIDIYPNGGTVTDVSINGTSTGGPRGLIHLPPLGTVSLTYAAAPTWTWFAST